MEPTVVSILAKAGIAGLLFGVVTIWEALAAVNEFRPIREERAEGEPLNQSTAHKYISLAATAWGTLVRQKMAFDDSGVTAYRMIEEGKSNLQIAARLGWAQLSKLWGK
jgi:hypothetical protein